MIVLQILIILAACVFNSYLSYSTLNDPLISPTSSGHVYSFDPYFCTTDSSRPYHAHAFPLLNSQEIYVVAKYPKPNEL